MVTRPYAHAKLVENLGDVVGMYALHVQADYAATFDGVQRADDANSSVECQLETCQGVRGELTLVRDHGSHPERFEVSHRGVEPHRLGDGWRAGFKARDASRGGVAVSSYVGDHAAAAEERGHGVQDFLAGPQHPNPRGSEHLVSGKCQKVKFEIGDVRRAMGYRLRPVDRDQRVDAVRGAGQFFQGVLRAEYVGHARDGKQTNAL